MKEDKYTDRRIQTSFDSGASERRRGKRKYVMEAGQSTRTRDLQVRWRVVPLLPGALIRGLVPRNAIRRGCLRLPFRFLADGKIRRRKGFSFGQEARLGTRLLECPLENPLND